jgi:hypothetical protein
MRGRQDLNLQPLVLETNTLPLSYPQRREWDSNPWYFKQYNTLAKYRSRPLSDPPYKQLKNIKYGLDKKLSDISTGQLKEFPLVHPQPIKVIIYYFPHRKNKDRTSYLNMSSVVIPARVATQRCYWNNSWYTIGVILPVLAY